MKDSGMKKDKISTDTLI